MATQQVVALRVTRFDVWNEPDDVAVVRSWLGAALAPPGFEERGVYRHGYLRPPPPNGWCFDLQAA